MNILITKVGDQENFYGPFDEETATNRDFGSELECEWRIEQIQDLPSDEDLTAEQSSFIRLHNAFRSYMAETGEPFGYVVQALDENINS